MRNYSTFMIIEHINTLESILEIKGLAILTLKPSKIIDLDDGTKRR